MTFHRWPLAGLLLLCPWLAGAQRESGPAESAAASATDAGPQPDQRPAEPPPASDAKKDSAPPRSASGPAADPAQDESRRRIELNLLGKTDAATGESRRNENVTFNLVDNNALKELNVRLGTTATIVREFLPSRGYFGAEFGVPPAAALTVPSAIAPSLHGRVFYGHQNSVITARSFFQVGDVEPARDNDFGFVLGSSLGRRARFLIDARKEKLRGSVNGNVLVPRADERTPLVADAETRALVARYLDAYPDELPNRTDVNPRALNTNAPQRIDNSDAGARLDRTLGAAGRLALDYRFTSQTVDAFQLVAGQNPDTDTRAHRARIVWTRPWSASTVSDFSVGFDRVTSNLRPEENAVGPMISVSGLETLGPQGSIPIRRAQNLFRYAAEVRRAGGRHAWSAGAAALRRQFNGIESDAHRGFFSFASDFGRDGITNLRLGAPTQHIIAIGDVHRGFRSWELQLFAGDVWKAARSLTVNYGLRYQPAPHPSEVAGRNTIPYDGDFNNLAPQLGIAYRLPRRGGVLRAGYGVQFGEIFPVTFQQVRFSPPGSTKYVVVAPSLIDPLHRRTQDGSLPDIRGNLYLLDPELATPYAYQYNASWEPDWLGQWRLQVGYVGSRAHKLLIMWYQNRAHPVAGVAQTTATINQRRPDPEHAEVRWVLNGSRGYFDAARVSLVVPRWKRLSLDASYWFSKALDLGASYTNTAYENDSRISRSQWEFETHRDMKGPSSFDQTHAFLISGSYDLPAAGARPVAALARGWSLSAVLLAKSGIPFNVTSGSDGPGFGNVDGNGGDRPNLVDPSILGRSIGHPDTSRLLLPRSAFAAMQPTDARGNLGRNVFRKGGIRNVNASLARSWTLGGERRLRFRAESINLFNTPQFAEPGSELANANFGQITNTLNDGRTFRFRVEILW